MAFITRDKDAALLSSSGAKPLPPLPTGSAVLHNNSTTTTGGGVGGRRGGTACTIISSTSSLLDISSNDTLHSLREIASSSSCESSAVRFFDLKNIFHSDVHFRVKVRSCCRKCILVCPACGKLSPGASVKVRFCVKKQLTFQRDVMVEATVILPPPFGLQSIFGFNNDLRPCKYYNVESGLRAIGCGGVRKRVSSSSASCLLPSECRENSLKKRRVSFIYTPPLEDLQSNAAAAALEDQGRRNEPKSTTKPITTTEAVAVAWKTKPKKQVRFADPVESALYYI